MKDHQVAYNIFIIIISLILINAVVAILAQVSCALVYEPLTMPRRVCKNDDVDMNMETIFARGLLFLTPSDFVSFGDNIIVSCTTAEDDLNDMQVNTLEGESFASPELMAYILGIPVDSLRRIYPPCQFRGLFFAQSIGFTVLGKGMLKINWKLLGKHLVLTADCVKARSPGRETDIKYGLDRCKIFSQPMKDPTINSGWWGALSLRHASMPMGDERKRAADMLMKWVLKQVAWNKRSIVERAFGLPDGKDKPKRDQLRRVGDPKAYLGAMRRADPGRRLSEERLNNAEALCGAAAGVEPLVKVRKPLKDIAQKV
jgi:hypothetical protein